MKVVILAGGGGSRLFPLSRSCYPKQFLHIAGEKSLLVQTVERFLGIAKPEDIIIVTNKDYIYHVQAELKEAKAEAAQIITEPVGRNTAPAIALAMAYIKSCGADSNETIFISPADHLIKPAEVFKQIILNAQSLTADDKIVTFGIVPDKPETGYGYIKAGKNVSESAFMAEAFKEKPDKKTAEEYVKAGNYYWNSGMFMFSIETMEKELSLYAPQIYTAYNKGYEALLKEFTEMPDISIDYAVAEKSAKMAVVSLNGVYWNDIGSWDAIAETFSDSTGNMYSGDIVAENCTNTMILGQERLIAGLDLQNLMVVDTPDVLLVAQKGKSQDVKQLVNKLKKEKRKEVDENRTMYRPWGSYTILAEGDGYKVKRITINPGAKLSLQLHYHRSEHWTVISGTGKLTLDDKEVFFRENESTYIPIGVRHRLENPGKLPLSIIEVQNGKYLGEDDIVRFDDVYGREAE
jgi:mannose-1-phosphate guanylyltransferase/mannose-6-phosphate isomerase